MRAIERQALQSEAIGLCALAWGMEQGARSLLGEFADLPLALCPLPLHAHLSIDTVSSFFSEGE